MFIKMKRSNLVMHIQICTLKCRFLLFWFFSVILHLSRRESLPFDLEEVIKRRIKTFMQKKLSWFSRFVFICRRKPRISFVARRGQRDRTTDRRTDRKSDRHIDKQSSKRKIFQSNDSDKCILSKVFNWIMDNGNAANAFQSNPIQYFAWLSWVICSIYSQLFKRR